MKRVLAIICVLAIAACLMTACSKYSSTKVNGVEIEAQPYQYDGRNYAVLLMTNKTGNNCNLEVNVTFLDAAGQTVDTDTVYMYGVEKGATVADRVRSSEAFATCAYTVTTTPSTDMPIDGDLKVKVEDRPGMVTFTVENKGDYPTKNAEYIACFYNDGNIIYSYTGSCDNIYPSGTVGEMITPSVAFDDVEVYVHGTASLS